MTELEQRRLAEIAEQIQLVCRTPTEARAWLKRAIEIMEGQRNGDL